MSKKNLNTDAIANELQGASLFFQRPTSPAVQRPKETVFEVKNERMNERSDDQSNERTIVQIEKPSRRVIRHTFDIYRDQLISLQQLQIGVMTRGRRKPKLGRMVQKALDLYISREMKKQKQKQG